MKRAFYFSTWIVGVPWLACFLWFLCQTRMHRTLFCHAKFHEEVMVQWIYAGVWLASYGTMICLFVTVPLSILTYVLAMNYPQYVRSVRCTRSIGIVAVAVGIVWALLIATQFRIEDGRQSLLITGGCGGLVLWFITVKCLKQGNRT